MTVQNLYDILEGRLSRCPKDANDCVCIRVTENYLGSQPIENVDHVSFGIDWDKDKLIIYPKNNLYRGGAPC